jgi:ribosomal protein S6
MPTTIKNWNKLKDLVMNMEGDVNKFDDKGVKASARRIRKDLQAIKVLASQFRKDIQEEVNS